METQALLARKRFTMDKFSSELKVQTEEMIKSVLSVSATSAISSTECMNGFVTVNGKTKVNVVFVTEEGKLTSAEGVLEFSEKQQSMFALEKCHAVDEIKVSSHTFMGNEILCFLEHEVSVCGNFKYEISEFSEADDELVLSKKSFSALRFVANAEDNFIVAEESESNAQGVNVLSAQAKTILSEVVCLVDKIVVQGKVLAEAVYADASGVSVISKECEFKQEIAAEGTLPNMVPDVHAEVKNVSVTAEELQDKTNFVFVFDIFAKAYIYDENNYEVTTDLFSLKSELQTAYSYVEMKNYHSVKTFNDTALSVSDVSEIEGFEDVVAVYAPKYEFVNLEKQDGKYVVTGMLSATALYRASEELCIKTINSEVKVEVSAEQEAELRELQVVPSVSSYKVKAGRDLEVMFALYCTAKNETALSEKFVKSYELISEKPENLYAVRVYVTSDGESLFDVARNLNVKPEVISSQNEVADTFTQGEKIYIYSPVNLA